MKKLLLFTVFAVSTITTSLAQTSTSPKFSINLETGKPIGEGGDYYSSTFGGSLKYLLPVIEDGAFFTSSFGYTRLITSTEYKKSGVPSSFGFIPVKAGIRDYLDKGLYAGFEAGGVFGTTSGFGNKIAYAINSGYSFNRIEIGFRYEGWISETSPINQLAAHLGVRF